jgi:ABC-2 type transport system permease protein
MRALTSLTATFVRIAASRARIIGFLVVSVVSVLVAWRVGRSPTATPAQRTFDLADRGVLSFLAPVAALVFGTAVLGDPSEDGTLVYLWLRPIRRSVTTAGALIGALLLAVPAAVIPSVLIEVVVGSGGAPERAAATTALTVTAYTTVFVLLGLVTQRSLVWGIAYLLIVEQFIARGGQALGALSIRSYAASMRAAAGGAESPIVYFGATTSAVMLGAIAVTSTVLVRWRLDHAEVA